MWQREKIRTRISRIKAQFRGFFDWQGDSQESCPSFNQINHSSDIQEIEAGSIPGIYRP
jgi:hypothetical protein